MEMGGERCVRAEGKGACGCDRGGCAALGCEEALTVGTRLALELLRSSEVDFMLVDRADEETSVEARAKPSETDAGAGAGAGTGPKSSSPVTMAVVSEGCTMLVPDGCVKGARARA
jgi:hypothetical protein